MAVVAVLGFACTIPKLIEEGNNVANIIDKSLDLITITVPPALPATMSVGVAFAVRRLKQQQIYCISPPRVNVSGRVQIMVFDKTGTLTEDGLQILGVRGIEGDLLANDGEAAHFTDFVDTIKDIIPSDPFSVPLNNNVLMSEAMASCHSITLVDGELVGDPLEIKMFWSTGWELDERAQTVGSEAVLCHVTPP